MPSHNYALHRLEMIDWRQFPLYKQKGTPNPVFPYFMISIIVKVAMYSILQIWNKLVPYLICFWMFFKGSSILSPNHPKYFSFQPLNLFITNQLGNHADCWTTRQRIRIEAIRWDWWEWSRTKYDNDLLSSSWMWCYIEKSLVQSIRDTFEKNQEYNKEKSLFSIIHSIVDLILSIFMLLMGIEPYFWDLSKQITLVFLVRQFDDSFSGSICLKQIISMFPFSWLWILFSILFLKSPFLSIAHSWLKQSMHVFGGCDS